MKYILFFCVGVFSAVLFSSCGRIASETLPADTVVAPSADVIQQQEKFDQALIEKRHQLGE